MQDPGEGKVLVGGAGVVNLGGRTALTAGLEQHLYDGKVRFGIGADLDVLDVRRKDPNIERIGQAGRLQAAAQRFGLDLACEHAAGGFDHRRSGHGITDPGNRRSDLVNAVARGAIGRAPFV